MIAPRTESQIGGASKRSFDKGGEESGRELSQADELLTEIRSRFGERQHLVSEFQDAEKEIEQATTEIKEMKKNIERICREKGDELYGPPRDAFEMHGDNMEGYDFGPIMENIIPGDKRIDYGSPEWVDEVKKRMGNTDIKPKVNRAVNEVLKECDPEKFSNLRQELKKAESYFKLLKIALEDADELMKKRFASLTEAQKSLPQSESARIEKRIQRLKREMGDDYKIFSRPLN